MAVQPQLHAQVIRQLTNAGAKVIAYDVQFTEESGDADADNGADRRPCARPANVVLAATEISEDGKTRIFGGGEALEFSRGDPRRTATSRTTSTAASAGCPTTRRSSRACDRRARVGRSGSPVRTRRATRRWIDYAGPPRRCRTSSFGDVAKGKFPASAVRGKYRRRRRHARRRSRTATRPRRPGPADAGAGDPGECDRPPPSTASRCDTHLVVERLAPARAARPSSRRSLALRMRDRPGARARGRGTRRRCSSAPRSRSTTARSSRCLPAAGRRSPAIVATAAHPRPHRRVRARQHARRVRALRARVGRRPGARRTPTACASAACAARRP